jgi:hypothetical protein
MPGRVRSGPCDHERDDEAAVLVIDQGTDQSLDTVGAEGVGDDVRSDDSGNGSWRTGFLGIRGIRFSSEWCGICRFVWRLVANERKGNVLNRLELEAKSLIYGPYPIRP